MNNENGKPVLGRRVYGRKGSEFESIYGTVTGSSACHIESCRGTRLHVKWPDGKRTYPYLTGCIERANGDLEIK